LKVVPCLPVVRLLRAVFTSLRRSTAKSGTSSASFANLCLSSWRNPATAAEANILRTGCPLGKSAAETICWAVRQRVFKCPSTNTFFTARWAMIMPLIRSAIKASIPVTPYISAILTNSIVAVIASSGANSPKMTRPRCSHCTSNWKLRVEITPSSSLKSIDWSSPSWNFPSNAASKYRDCLHRRAFGSLYSWLGDPTRIVTCGPE